MKKISLAKMVILLFLIPFCIYLFFRIHSYWTGRLSHEDLDNQKEVEEIARVEQFEIKGLELDREAFTLKAKEFTQLKEGISLLQHIDPFTLYTTRGKKIVLFGEKGMMIESKGDHSKIIVEGKVNIQTEEGQKLETAKITYDVLSKEVYADSEVAFSGEGFHGTASHMHYFLEKEEIKLAPHFNLWLEGKNGTIHVQSAAFEGSLDFKKGFLKGGVSIRDQQKEIFAQEARIFWDNETEQWREIQLLNNVHGLSHQKGENRYSLVKFNADRMNILLNNQQTIDAINMEGSILILMENKEDSDGNYRKLNCDRLASIWKEGKILEIEAEGSVKAEIMEKSSKAPQFPETLSCHSLSISFDQNGAIKKAQSFGSIRFQSGTTKGNSEVAGYNSEKKQITLKEKQNQRPYLTSDVWSVHAQEIIIKNRNEISASGSVKTLYKEKNCKNCEIPMFQSNKSVFISSDQLDISEGEKAIYYGNVRAWQEENSIEAQKVHIWLKDNIFEAHGDVISRFSRLSSMNHDQKTEKIEEDQDPQQRIEVQSDDLFYSSEKRKATYKGHIVSHLKESKMSCSEMDVIFSEQGRAEEIRAESDILIESSDFQAEGDLLEYSLSEHFGYLRGTLGPARVYSKSGDEMAVASSLTFHMQEDNINLLSKDRGRTWMTFK